MPDTSGAPAKSTVKLEEFLEVQRAAPDLRVEFGDGDAVEVWAPVLWTDEISAALAGGRFREGLAAMNGEAWERFEAAGGTWRIVNHLYEQSKAPAEPSLGE